MSVALKLTVITGPHHRARFCLRHVGEHTIGRAPECRMRLCGHVRDQLISRHHCKIGIESERIWVRDLHSLNGTFLNGVKLKQDKIDLLDGDMITIGATTVHVELVDCPSCLGALKASEPLSEEILKFCGGVLERCEGDCARANRATILNDGATLVWEV